MNKYNNRCTHILIPNYFIGHRITSYTIPTTLEEKYFADNTGFEPAFPAYYAGVLDR